MKEITSLKKVLLFLVFGMTAISGRAQESTEWTLKEAIRQNLVRAEGVYNDRSVHYLKPVLLTLINLTNRPLKVRITSGDLLEPADTNCQTMMITSDMQVALQPMQSKKTEPFGMCTEPSDAAGRKGLKYHWTANKNTALMRIAGYINQNKLFDPAGQSAVWCVADKSRALTEITGLDSNHVYQLITEVAAITGRPVPSRKELRGLYHNYAAPVKTETIGGSFEFQFSETSKVHIAMFNPQGTLVRELYFNPAERPGVHKMNFEFDYTAYQEDYYDIKLIANNEVVLSSRIDRSDDNWIEQR